MIKPIYVFIFISSLTFFYSSPAGHKFNPSEQQYTKLHTLYNTSDTILYIGLYFNNQQVPYINAQKIISLDPIAVIYPGGQLKLHIPYQTGYFFDSYPLIICTPYKNLLTTTLPPISQNTHAYLWDYGSKYTAWASSISFTIHNNIITITEKTPEKIAYEQEMYDLTDKVHPYKPYTFENTLDAPIYASFYIKGQQVPYYNYHNNKSIDNHVLKINPHTKETVTIPYIENWINNNYPVIAFSFDNALLQKIFTNKNLSQSYNLNQEKWGYFTFSQNSNTNLLMLRSTPVVGIKEALANSSLYTIYNNTDTVLHFNLYYKTNDGVFKSITTQKDKQYMLNAVKGKKNKTFKVPNIQAMRLYITPHQHLLTTIAPPISSDMTVYEFSHPLHQLYKNITVYRNKNRSLSVVNKITSLSPHILNSLKSTPQSIINNTLIAKNIISILLKGLWHNNVFNSCVALGTDYYSNTYQHKYFHKTQSREAYIESNNKLSDQENLYLSQHAPHEQIDNQSIRIALCSSGGGYRAFIGTLGFFDGLQSINYMDHITYNVGLSGSSWAINGWQASKQEKVASYKNDLFSRASRFLNHELYNQNNTEIKTIISQIIRDKILYPYTPFSIISLFGAIIAQRILTVSDSNALYISPHQQQSIHKPLCLHTALVPQKDIHSHKKGFYWLEFSPYHVSFIDYKQYHRIPLWAFGRQFNTTHSISTNYSPPLSLSFCLGMWGSTLSASVREIGNQKDVQSYLIPLLQLLQKNLSPSAPDFSSDMEHFDPEKIQHLINLALNSEQYKQLEKYNIFTDGRLRPPLIPSFIPSDQKFLTIIDAGIDFNIPLPPLLLPERNIDIIIINDASADLHTIGAGELKKALLYAKNIHGLEYNIVGEESANLLTNTTLSTDHLISLLKNNNRHFIVLKPKKSDINKKGPFIIYFPLLNPSYSIPQQLTAKMPTNKFLYSRQEAELLYHETKNKINIDLINEIKNLMKKN